MRALIVDDEPLALECALAMIDWAAEGVRHVDTARSAAQAKAALQERCGTDYPDAAAVFPLLCRVLTGSSQEGGERVKREISAALFSLCDEIVFLPLSAAGRCPRCASARAGWTLRSSAPGPRKSRACARPCTASGWPSFWTAPAAPGRSGWPWTVLSCWTGRTSGGRQAYSPPGSSRISPAAAPAPTSSSGPG